MDQIEELGYTREQSLKALKENNWDVEKAIDLLEKEDDQLLQNLSGVSFFNIGSSRSHDRKCHKLLLNGPCIQGKQRENTC